MPPRIQPRRIARELALLSLSQISAKSASEQEDLNKLILAAIRTLAAEVHEALEAAAAEAKRSSNLLLGSETRATDIASAKAMVSEALVSTQTAINRLGSALELPELVVLSNQSEVRQYALEIVRAVKQRHQDIEQTIKDALVDWQFDRLAKIDRDLLRIAVAEILFLGVKDKVAINEAIELAKRYSDDDGYRFINGVLRRVTDRLSSQVPHSSFQSIGS